MNDLFVHKWTAQVKKGILSFIVLSVLKDNEYYGYELIEEIKKHTEIEIAEGTLYPLLNRLKNEELLTSKWVEQESGIPRKYHVLTKKGNDTLQEMKKYWVNMNTSIQKLMIK
ncbi:MAG: PadR family transcriptional regulator [Marinilabiliales bacterium]|nr:MAG: PadR family transcriptional regulator [Marinilabiliales bacterium]